MQHLHGAGHCDVQQSGAERRSVEDQVGIDDHDAIELEAFHGLGGEHRNIGVGQFVNVIDSSQIVGGECFPDRFVQRRRCDNAGCGAGVPVR